MIVFAPPIGDDLAVGTLVLLLVIRVILAPEFGLLETVLSEFAESTGLRVSRFGATGGSGTTLGAGSTGTVIIITVILRLHQRGYLGGLGDFWYKTRTFGVCRVKGESCEKGERTRISRSSSFWIIILIEIVCFV